MVAEFQNKPFGSSGEMMVPNPDVPPPMPAAQPFVPPPPPWQADLEAGNLDLAAALNPEPSVERIPALAALKAAGGDGYDPPAYAPPAEPLKPLLPVQIPKPDWRAEELERARRDAKPGQLDEPEKSLQQRPA